MDTKAIKERFDSLRSERKNWDVMYQVLGEYVSQVKQNFEAQPQSGDFLIDEIYDSTATFAAHSAASALLGMLWPGTAKQAIEIKPPDGLEDTKELDEFYSRATNILCREMDNPSANLGVSFAEYMIDQLIFGTSGVGVESGDDSMLLYKPYGVKELYIDEGKNGRVDTEMLFFEWTIRRIVDEYGIENVSEKVKDKFHNNKLNERVKILVYMAERMNFEAEEGALAMPIMSLHFEYDNNMHLLKESGFSSLPIEVGRFNKLNYERYGRSPAMMALPDIKEINVLREAVIVATGKNLDPSLGVMSDGILGGNVIDTSAGAINVFNPTVGGNSSPIFPIVTVGSIPDALARIEDLKESISQHFFLDRLIDFNNDVQMTFGEAQIRNAIRNASLSSIYSRQISEVFTPLIARSFEILMQKGEFGVIKGSEQEEEMMERGVKPKYIPDILAERIENGEDIYQINYKTQAANAQRSEEYIGILDVLSFGIQAMQVDPSVRHRINLHEGLKNIGDIRGLPVGVLRADDEVQRAIEVDEQQMAAQQQLQVGAQAAGIVDTLASANKAVRV